MVMIHVEAGPGSLSYRTLPPSWASGQLAPLPSLRSRSPSNVQRELRQRRCWLISTSPTHCPVSKRHFIDQTTPSEQHRFIDTAHYFLETLGLHSVGLRISARNPSSLSRTGARHHRYHPGYRTLNILCPLPYRPRCHKSTPCPTIKYVYILNT